MEKINRWVAKHVWLVYVAAMVLWILTICRLANGLDGAVLLILYILTIAWILLCAQWIFTRSNALLKKPLEILQNECDPYPFLEEVKHQRAFSGNQNMKLTYIFNEVLALREVGEFEQAHRLLLAIPDKDVSNAAPMVQAMYFSHRLYRGARLKNLAEVEVCYRKLLDACNRTTRKTQKQYVDSLIAFARVIYHLARQEFDQSLQYLQMIPQNTLRDRVVVAWNYAAIHLGKGAKEAAKEKLEFVMNNGNKLYIVTEAKALLAKINMEET